MEITGYKDKHEYVSPQGVRSVVYLMDCMDAMAQMADKAFDLAIVDVPYTNKYNIMQNLNKDMKGKVAKVGKYHYHSLENAKPKKEYWNVLRQISKNQIVWGANYFVENLQSTPCVIVWDKDNTGNYADCEIAFGSFTTGAKVYQYRWNGMLQGDMKNKENRIHPTQKPIALYSWLLKNYAKQGDTILDTHLGSQSSRIAAYNGGFDFTGFELDEDYFRDGNKRFDNHVKQLRLEL